VPERSVFSFAGSLIQCSLCRIRQG